LPWRVKQAESGGAAALWRAAAAAKKKKKKKILEGQASKSRRIVLLRDFILLHELPCRTGFEVIANDITLTSQALLAEAQHH
jgi:hypothetical protein